MTTETIETIETGSKRKGRVADRDFTTCSEMHTDFAKYVNEHAGLSFISGKHIKAVLALRSEFVASAEHQAKLTQRKEEVAAEKEKAALEQAARNARYDGMTDGQIKAVKKADRLMQKAAEAKAEADRLLG